MRTLFAIALLLAPAGCDLLGNDPAAAPGPDARLRPGEEALTWYVAAHTAPCTGLYEQQCLLVKERPEAPWNFLYDPIAGFAHERGYAYRLRVARLHTAEPPADASAFSYRLLRVLEKTESASAARNP